MGGNPQDYDGQKIVDVVIQDGQIVSGTETIILPGQEPQVTDLAPQDD